MHGGDVRPAVAISPFDVSKALVAIDKAILHARPIANNSEGPLSRQTAAAQVAISIFLKAVIR
jgi:hypothetical protein